MNYKFELKEAFLLKRYKRFFADIEMPDGTLWTVHVPNTGSLKGVIDKNSKKPQNCWVTLHHDPSKKLAGTLEAVQCPTGAWVGVNTSTPNKIVKEVAESSIETGKPFLKHWGKFRYFKPEFKINADSRLDGAFSINEDDLTNAKAIKHFIEIKNTTLQRKIGKKSHALFPDSVTERGEKHLREMIKLMDQGHSCELIFAVQRSDVDCFSVAADIDPEYGVTFKKAVKKGLRITPLVVELDKKKVQLTSRQLDLIID